MYNNKKERYVMITMMKIMRKIKIIIIIKKLLKKKTNKQTNTITTNETLIYNGQNTNSGRETERKKNTHLLHPDYKKRLPCLICSVNITFIKTKRSICL